MKLCPDIGGAFSARLELERDGNFAQLLERIRPEGHSCATGPHPYSGPFHQSHRRQRFLEYLVNETLAGRGERLKAYNVALEVFDRPETFDPVVDPLVRVEAARLREKLREITEPTAKAIPFTSTYRRERTPRTSSFRRADSRSTIFRSRSASTACPPIPGQFRSARPLPKSAGRAWRCWPPLFC